jgi:hypothetical protein
MFDAPFNVVAGFRTHEQAETAARRVASLALPGGRVEVGSRRDAGGAVETAELRAEMQEELGASWAPATGRQARGAVFGVAALATIGLVLGAVVGFVLGLTLDLGVPLATMTVLGAIIGTVAGSVVGLVVGGGVAPRMGSHGDAEFDDPTPAAERDILLAVHVSEPEAAERAARMLRDELDADRVDLVDATGTPLPPQRDHPRPADPEGYWWKAAGQG